MDTEVIVSDEDAADAMKQRILDLMSNEDTNAATDFLTISYVLATMLVQPYVKDRADLARELIEHVIDLANSHAKPGAEQPPARIIEVNKSSIVEHTSDQDCPACQLMRDGQAEIIAIMEEMPVDNASKITLSQRMLAGTIAACIADPAGWQAMADTVAERVKLSLTRFATSRAATRH